MRKEREMLKRIGEAIPDSLKKWVYTHISWGLDASTPTAYADITSKGYVINFSPAFVEELNDKELEGLWLHELQHVIRGDVFIPPDEISEELTTGIEYVINERLLQKGVTLPADGITADTLRVASQGKEPPDPIHGMHWVAEWLRQNNVRLNVHRDFKLSPRSAEARKKHVETVLSMPRNGLLPGANIMNPYELRHKPLTLDITPVARLASQVYSMVRGRSVRWRNSYLREHNSVADLPGYASVPSTKVILGLDASGSMSEYVETYWELYRALRGMGCDTETWVWADRAAPWPAGLPMPDVGGGTQLVPFVGAIAHVPAAVIVLTDAEIFDVGEAASIVSNAAFTSFIWALVRNRTPPFPGDHVVELVKTGQLRR